MDKPKIYVVCLCFLWLPWSLVSGTSLSLCNYKLLPDCLHPCLVACPALWCVPFSLCQSLFLCPFISVCFQWVYQQSPLCLSRVLTSFHVLVSFACRFGYRCLCNWLPVYQNRLQLKCLTRLRLACVCLWVRLQGLPALIQGHRWLCLYRHSTCVNARHKIIQSVIQDSQNLSCMRKYLLYLLPTYLGD